MPVATGNFAIRLEPQGVHESPSDLGRLAIHKDFRGGLIGVSPAADHAYVLEYVLP